MGNITDTATLAEKCVINLCDGKNLGYVCDVRFDVCDGRIKALLIPREQGILSFGKCEYIIVPWDNIECVGEDAILVRLSPCEREYIGERCECEHEKRRKRFFGF